MKQRQKNVLAILILVACYAAVGTLEYQEQVAFAQQGQ